MITEAEIPQKELEARLTLVTEMGKLLADPKHWIKNALAIDHEDNEVDPTEATACAFCLLGASHYVIQNVPGMWDYFSGHFSFVSCSDVLGLPGSVSVFNDELSRTHGEILALLASRKKHYEALLNKVK